MTKISWIQIFATVFQLITSIAGLCNETNVGIRDELKIIPDDQMTNSTNNGSDFLPEFGRLHGAKAWCPDTVPTNDSDPYLQIDLGQTYVICAVEVQGLPGATLETNFTLSYDDGMAFVDYNQQFNGSAPDGDVADFHELTPTITTQAIRFKPTSASICLRVEVYGTPEGVDVTCNENDMQVQINRGVHKGFLDPAGGLSLRNSSCLAESNDASSINFTITLGTCNTTVYISNDGEKSFYHNIIKNSTSDDFNIICSYIREPTQLGTETGSFSFEMNIFTDDTFETPVPSGPISLSASLYFLIDVKSSDTNTELHLTSCRATPSINPLDPTNYTFIENGCDVESANDFITGYNCTKTDNNQTFVLSVFRFAGEPAGSLIYFHCDAIVCLISPTSDCTTQCDACPSGSRKRRDLRGGSKEDLAEAHLVLGPYTIIDIDEDNDEQDDIDDRPEKEDQTEAIKDSENFPVTIVVVVCVSAFVAMAIIAALLVTIRLSKNARGPAVKEVTADLARDNLGFDELDITTLSMKPNDKAI